MKKSFLGLYCLPILLTSSLSLADTKFIVIQGADRTEPKLARVGVTTHPDGSALLSLYSENNATVDCTIKVKNPADAVALSNQIVARPARSRLTVFCMKGKTLEETLLHIENTL